MTEYPRGAVANVEYQQAHDEFVRAVEPEYVVMRITHARRLMKNGTSFPEHYPDSVSVITTTTVRDNRLNLIGWERDDEDLQGYSELDIVRETEPDFHVPTDYSIYEEMDEDEQMESVVSCVEGTKWMYEHTADLDTRLIPLLKGRTREQRDLFYEMYDEYDVDYVAFYATQYFTGGAGLLQSDLVGDVQKFALESDAEMFVMGALSPRLVRTFPGSVVAVSGFNQWRKRCSPRESSAAEMRSAYADLEDEVAAALAEDEYATTDA